MTDASVADLTFVTKKARNDIGGTFNLWTPERPDDVTEARQMGHDYAAELMLMIRKTGEHQIFGAVIRAISESGTYGPVEMGFCHAIGIELLGIPHCDSIVRGNTPFTVAPKLDDA